MKNKIYQVIMQDEYNNLYFLGFYKNLEDAIPDINDWLSIYNIEIDELEEYASTYSRCFDRCFDLDEGPIYIRGFIFDEKDLNVMIKGEK